VIFQEKRLKLLKCYNFLSATTKQLLSSGEFCKLRYDTISVKSASANVSFYTNNSKMPNFEFWHCCRKWAMCWLRHCATSRKVTGSIPDGVIRSFHWRKCFRSQYGPGVDSASTRFFFFVISQSAAICPKTFSSCIDSHY